MDFELEFNSNFSSTYQRPNRPQQQSMCRQGDNENDRDYLTRWSTLRNSCEGVIESQAIAWFAQGCKHGSMLWQRLQREMPLTLAETIRIADSYALGDPSQPLVNSVDTGKRYPGNQVAGSSRRNDRQDFGGKRRDDQPDPRYGSHQVAAVEQEQQGGGYSQRPKNDGPSWGQNQDNQRGFDQNRPSDDRYTYEKMLDGAYRYHTSNPRKPANHSTRQCSWYERTVRDAQAGPARPRFPPELRIAQLRLQISRDPMLRICRVSRQ